jgi:hypothetical protein
MNRSIIIIVKEISHPYIDFTIWQHFLMLLTQFFIPFVKGPWLFSWSHRTFSVCDNVFSLNDWHFCVFFSGYGTVKWTKSFIPYAEENYHLLVCDTWSRVCVTKLYSCSLLCTYSVGCEHIPMHELSFKSITTLHIWVSLHPRRYLEVSKVSRVLIHQHVNILCREQFNYLPLCLKEPYNSLQLHSIFYVYDKTCYKWTLPF